MIKTVGLRKIYRTKTVETTALAEVSLEIEEGEHVAVMGPSGCGKSTLLNVLGLIEPTTGGQYWFLGQDVAPWSERRRAALRKTIGFVFQSFNLIDDLTVFQNVELPLSYLRVPAAERRRRVTEMLTSLALDERRDALPYQLSGGQQQRVAIARALVVRPRLLLADEPTGNLDSARGAEVMDLLEQANAGGTTLVMVTHSAADAARARRVIHLLDGRIVSAAADPLLAGATESRAGFGAAVPPPAETVSDLRQGAAR